MIKGDACYDVLKYIFGGKPVMVSMWFFIA